MLKDFTVLVAYISSNEESDLETDLNVKTPTEELVNNWVEVSDDPSASSVSGKTTRKLLQGGNKRQIIGFILLRLVKKINFLSRF